MNALKIKRFPLRHVVVNGFRDVVHFAMLIKPPAHRFARQMRNVVDHKFASLGVQLPPAALLSTFDGMLAALALRRASDALQAVCRCREDADDTFAEHDDGGLVEC